MRVHFFASVGIHNLLIDGKGLSCHLCGSDGVGVDGVMNLFDAGIETVLSEVGSLKLAQGDDGIDVLNVFALNQQQVDALGLAHGTKGKGLHLTVESNHTTDVHFLGATKSLELKHLVYAMNMDNISLEVTSLLVKGFLVIGHLYVGTLTESLYQELNMTLYQLVTPWVDM